MSVISSSELYLCPLRRSFPTSDSSALIVNIERIEGTNNLRLDKTYEEIINAMPNVCVYSENDYPGNIYNGKYTIQYANRMDADVFAIGFNSNNFGESPNHIIFGCEHKYEYPIKENP